MIQAIDISERLKVITTLIPDDTHVLADIGSDHAYLPCYAYQMGKVNNAIAGEVGYGPLRSAEQTIKTWELQSVIETRQGDGLAVLEYAEADVVVIAGMGGALIRDILAAGHQILSPTTTLLLQPNNCEPEVRGWLNDEGWAIHSERLIQENGHYYEIICADRSRQPGSLSRKELLFGPILLHNPSDPAFRAKWSHEWDKRKKILSSLSKATMAASVQEKKRRFQREQSYIEEVLSWEKT
ncbi:tRNA (adenine(22)-N(1))-methyltransferase [Tuberibacillus sp. Marseille-P3662]|uniref:tRNA (adenine(22)-N(1))-methyltransferase n=1 Tax=Tuberibacillus sp. Marseille-P3662 TaxID=1965358 RepID=UPI000A1CB150|nr:class I SAM-dependent methyltransferase [Tuberibacillus sp. Marseille-P3662]